jgi:glycosyltransferase involved in cell wall biosynthesis
VQSKCAPVSVIIPVYNGEVYLEKTLESALSQDPQPLELIVVDDGSTDTTAQIAQDRHPRIRYIYQANAGTPAARNRGLGMARGEIVGFLDADDLWSPGKIDIQTQHLGRHPSVDIVLGRTQMIMLAEDADGRAHFREYGDPEYCPSVGSALFRRGAFKTVGLFDESRRFCDDVDWFLRAKEKGLSLMHHPEVVQYYRRHQTNITNQRDEDRRHLLTAIKNSLDRRRQEGGGDVNSLPQWLAPEK